ncbi:photosynthesis system II assembly factor YCF48-like protein [Kribbella antiqua]|uniref:Photosynthesis system II assembly factor YCF48-like protein n=2 Tax=Kribbella antiqua TaxID=2512217 RepID=A0A4V2S4Q4_9ACTN|nr:photosynthesis system II assembly factor YCF48-like protein [Kribbella antiqua]
MSQLVPAQASPSYQWELTPTGSTAQFRGLSAVSKDVAWVGGTGGTVLRTVDGGKSWQNVSPAGASALQFRDVEAFDAQRAVILSIGTGEDSRIYRTADGGKSWTETFRNTDPNAFYDCLAFNSNKHGLALSDPVDGKFRIAATSDGGKSWQVQPTAGMPDALPGEFAFAASGTCLVAGPGRTAWFATGGGDRPRVFRTVDGGKRWTVADSPMASGDAAGIFSLAFRGPLFGVAVGGDFLKPTEAVKAASVTSDGGRTWKLVPADKAPKGYRSGSAFVPWAASTVVAVGPSGSDVSYDGGRSWKQFYDGSFDSVECAGHGLQAGCWASGAKGAVARLAH